MVRIQLIKTDDPMTVLAIKELDKECFPKDFPCDPSIGVWWVAKIGSEVVGYAGLMDSPMESIKTAYFCRAGVLEKYRGGGIYKKLIRKSVSYARDHGYKEILTDTALYNVPSSNALMSCGFKLFIPVKKWSFSRGLYWFRKL